MREFGVGQSVPRFEDARLLSGHGRYTDDLVPADLVHGYVLRSPHPHARIRSIDTTAALTAPGVLAVLTGTDAVADGLGTVQPMVWRKRRDGSPMVLPAYRVLAIGKVARVGDPVAFVVAESLANAKDAAERIEIDYQPLPVAIGTGRLITAETPAVWPEAPDNVSFVFSRCTNRGLPDGEDTRLFLNGDLQFSSVDEYRYHEALVHPALAQKRDNILILGGGDGLALREVLKYRDVQSVHLVELDPRMIDLARTDPRLTELNGNAFADTRVSVVTADAFNWLREDSGLFDAVIVDMPDPDETATAKLYSVEFYGLIRRHLAPGARMVVQAGSPYFAPRSFWCIGQSIAEAGMTTAAYHVDVPSFGDWGFFLGAEGSVAPAVTVDPVVDRRFLSADELDAARTFPPDRPPLAMPSSTLMQPRILEYSQSEWSVY